MDPREKTDILANAVDAEESDIDEYETLLASRFTTDPHIPSMPAVGVGLEVPREAPPPRADVDARLAALQRKLYPKRK